MLQLEERATSQSEPLCNTMPCSITVTAARAVSEYMILSSLYRCRDFRQEQHHHAISLSQVSIHPPENESLSPTYIALRFIGEETYSKGSSKDYLVNEEPTWIVDPLDGEYLLSVSTHYQPTDSHLTQEL